MYSSIESISSSNNRDRCIQVSKRKGRILSKAITEWRDTDMISDA